MTIAFWCVLAAALLPYATVALGKFDRGYDNRSPRDWESGLQGRQRRAIFAHQNHFEAFPAFAAAVVIAHLAGAPQGPMDAAAATFVALRIAYTWAYVADRATVRSLLWMGGLACVIALFAIAAAAR
ncbi:MAG TPA: MAPEG family protein [Usitatibacter sp.]|nr:MAPEG family protein [Usitatibacter sp.]